MGVEPAVGADGEPAEGGEREVDAAAEPAGALEEEVAAHRQPGSADGGSPHAVVRVGAARGTVGSGDRRVADDDPAGDLCGVEQDRAVGLQAPPTLPPDQVDAAPDNSVVHAKGHAFHVGEVRAGEVDRPVDLGAEQPHLAARGEVVEPDGTADLYAVGLDRPAVPRLDDGAHAQQPATDLGLAQPDCRGPGLARGGGQRSGDRRPRQVEIPAQVHAVAEQPGQIAPQHGQFLQRGAADIEG